MSLLSIFDPFAELNSSLNEAGYIFKLERFNDSFLLLLKFVELKYDLNLTKYNIIIL